MNKWIERAIFIDIIFIIFYVISDYAMWMRIPTDMNMMSHATGTFQDLRVITNYGLLIKSIDVGGAYTFAGGYINPQTYISQMPNLPFFIFLAMMLTNLFILGKASQNP
jgi:hypothetical protein